MNKDTLNNILQQHEGWLYRYDGKRATLEGVDLHGVDLHDVDLTDSSIRASNLMDTNLSFTNLSHADLTGTNLQRANLQRANLQRANLQFADLEFTNLKGANLKGANLSYANLKGAINVPYIPMSCPDEGAFIAWKKAFYLVDEDGYNVDEYLVKLLIPEDARRSSATGRKCRADKAMVLSIEPIVATSTIPEVVYSKYDRSFAYKVGKILVVPDFDTDRFNECSTGIHFFINRQEAIDYLF